MSQTPMDSSAPADKNDEAAFSANYWRLRQMVKEGQAWSGHERNCAFLNTGGGRFANISAVSGFDFLDDARGLALVDWDHDGDLDLWITNRTAPRVRVIRNDTPSGHHFLAVRLQGTTSNRDAIGARAELTIEGERGERKLIKTVRAGEGFVSQSSKWLHFGLGDASQTKQLTIRWPDGREEQFEGLDVDTRYWIVEGTHAAEVWTPPQRDVQLAAREPTLPAVTLQAATTLPVPLPLPPLEYALFDGQQEILTGRRDKPLLVNLWASWCLPCARELAEFTRRAGELRAAGLDVLALSVDGLGGGSDGGQSTTPADAQQALARWNFPFASGVATVGMLDKLQIVHNQLFELHRPLPVPTSLLIDTQGQLAAIYKGPVAVDALLADVDQLSRGADAWRLSALPFEGRWYDFPQASLMTLVSDLLERGYIDEAIQYARQNRPRLVGDSKYSWMMQRLGGELAKRGDLEAATAQFREALTADADDSKAYNNLGVALLKQGNLDEAIPNFRRAAQLNPDYAEAHYNLANVLANLGNHQQAVEHYISTLRSDPRRTSAARRLAWILAANDDPEVRNGAQAVRWAEQAAASTLHKDAGDLDLLAAAYAEAGRWDEAVATAQQAIALATTAGQAPLAQQIEARLRLYQQQKPFRAEPAR